MTIDKQTIDELAHLARLEFNEEEGKDMIKDLNKILSFVEKLNEMDTTGVEPLIYMSDETNVLRDDVAVQSITHEEAMKNAPKKDSDYFRISKVIENPS